MRRLLSLTGLLLLLGAPAAGAATRAQLTAYADQVATVWAARQDRVSGAFLDPASGRPSGGYGNVMMGYALMRTGERHGDERLIRAGVRGVSSSLDEPPSVRGVFDTVSVATAYNFARRRLADDPAFHAVRRRWARYLRSTGAPNVDNKAQACIVAPDCFHNHEGVGATADLELLATGIGSARDPATLRGEALTEVGQREPLFSQGSARIYGPGGESGLGLLSDTGSWPLAYHALSTAFLGRSIELLGAEAPQPARDALRRAAVTLAGFMAPDGTVAYIGRRQEDVWSLAAAIAAAELGAAHGGGSAADHARLQVVADRALERMKARYPLTPRGLPIVPRKGPEAFTGDGVDGNPMTFNALALYLLNIAADSAPAKRHAGSAKLPADRPGAFVDAQQSGFATVRHGRIWFAVHGRAVPPDLRNDFGLVAAKWRSPSGGWVDVVPPRPFAYSHRLTGGPVVVRNGQRLVPGGTVSLGHHGAVKVDGPLPVRFAPTRRGVRIALRAQPGDVVTYTAYVPKATRYPITPKPRARVKRGKRTLASCCSTSMVALKYRMRVRRARVVSFALEAPIREGRPQVGRPQGVVAGGKGGTNWLVVLISAVVLVALLAVRNLPWRP
ncbi:MAG: hypothetical protein QOG63_774 [Thermoleophilaceae bacterium]|nr:hypothetical protein [Thermoleophilaceae bacterium]